MAEIGPRAPEIGPKAPKIDARAAKIDARAPKIGPRAPKMAPRSPQEPPKRRKMVWSEAALSKTETGQVSAGAAGEGKEGDLPIPPGYGRTLNPTRGYPGGVRRI